MTTRVWRKSSFSGTQTDCVELAWDASTPLVRDSKNTRPEILRVSSVAWQRFLSATVVNY